MMRRGPFVYAVVFGGIAVLAFVGGWLVRHNSGSASFRVSPGVYSNIPRERADADLFILRIEGRDEMKGMVYAPRRHVFFMGISKNALFSRCLRQNRARILMYHHIHCGSPRGSSLTARKNHYF